MFLPGGIGDGEGELKGRGLASSVGLRARAENVIFAFSYGVDFDSLRYCTQNDIMLIVRGCVKESVYLVLPMELFFTLFPYVRLMPQPRSGTH